MSASVLYRALGIRGYTHQAIKEATDKLGKAVLKPPLGRCSKRPENLDTARGEAVRLQETLQLNESLATAYSFKEDLRQLWEQPSRFVVRRFPDD